MKATKLKKEERFVKWMRLLKQKQGKRLTSALAHSSPIEIANFLEFLEIQCIDIESIIQLFISLSIENQGEIFSLLQDREIQIQLYKRLPKSNFAKIFSSMPSDLRVDFYQRLSEKEHAHLLPYLNRKVREDVLMLNSYSPDTAGGIMNTDFTTVLNTMTIDEALNKIREDTPSKRMLYYIYVVNEKMNLVGTISLKDLVLHSPKEHIESILNTNFIYATVDEDQEIVARKIEQYDLLALPILNHAHQIVGIVNYDDAIDIIRAEQVEDMDKFMGITSEEDTPAYLKVSSLQHLKKRIKWIVILFMGSILSQCFEHIHADFFKLYHLFLYVSMIADTGGNVGSQAASVVLQALNRGQITLSDWSKIITKESKIAIMTAAILFILSYIKLSVIDIMVTFTTNEPMPKNYRVMFIVAFSVVFQVIVSILIGASLPLIVKYMNGDPAVAASPAINTIVELLGILIYYTIISCYLSPCKLAC